MPDTALTGPVEGNGIKAAQREPTELFAEVLPLVRQAHGGALRQDGNPGNSGGKVGRSGRPPDAWREKLSEAARKPEILAQVIACATNPESKWWGRAVEMLWDREFPKEMAAQAVAVFALNVRFRDE